MFPFLFCAYCVRLGNHAMSNAHHVSYHITPETMRITTSSTTVKNWTTTYAFGPIVPSTVPNMRQKKIIPKVLVPDLKQMYNNVLYLLLALWTFVNSWIYEKGDKKKRILEYTHGITQKNSHRTESFSQWWQCQIWRSHGCMKIMAFSAVMSCSMADKYQGFGVMCCLCFQPCSAIRCGIRSRIRQSQRVEIVSANHV